jgi:hypothetical protein
MRERAMETTKTLAKNFSGHGRQSVIYRETLVISNASHESHKLRVIIKSDCYDFQSSARIQRWDGDKWHDVHFIGGSAMSSRMSYETKPGQRHISKDRQELVRVAALVLFDEN